VDTPGWKKPSSNLPRLDTRLWPPYSGWPLAMVSSAARDRAPCRNKKARSTSTGEEICPQLVTIARIDNNTRQHNNSQVGNEDNDAKRVREQEGKSRIKEANERRKRMVESWEIEKQLTAMVQPCIHVTSTLNGDSIRGQFFSCPAVPHC
jgi:hypothetical protein